jgi:hypothetical protein
MRSAYKEDYPGLSVHYKFRSSLAAGVACCASYQQPPGILYYRLHTKLRCSGPELYVQRNTLTCASTIIIVHVSPSLLSPASYLVFLPLI